MGTPTTRTPVRIARGTYSNLNANKADILEGEICYAHDQNKLYIKEGSNLEANNPSTTFPGATFTDDVTVNAQKDLRFADSDSSNWIALQAPATIGSNITLTLPTADGSAGQYLKTDGSGNLGWATDATTDATKMPLAGGSFTGDVTLTAQKDLRFADSDSSNWVALQAPATVASNITWTLPAADSSGTQALTSNGSGTLGWATTGDATLANDNTWTGAQRGQITGLTSASTITIDMSTTNNHSVTLAHNTTFNAPSNQVAGQSGSIFITQDGTGSITASWNGNFKWKGGTAPTLSTAAASVDRIDYIILASGTIHAVATLDVK